ncbi:MAG: flagellar biosynthesis protein FlhA, partial [Polyangiaceae bacterium]
IQFVVIARGAERIAEVGARFVLDAMPGKQMAIEAELRSGGIDPSEARAKRAALTRESQFFGAMDGAMKFVKGDVVASILIVVINLVGGLAIGMAQHGLGLEESLKRYGLLSIGDGLVTQIPALVLSTAAGLLVTRTASEEEERSLGLDLAHQLFRTPRALGVAGGFVILLALVPGLPTIPFLVLGAALLGVAALRSRTRDAEIAEKKAADLVHGFVPALAPWSIHVSLDLDGLLEQRERELRSEIDSLRAEIFSELGAPLPAPDLAVRDSLAPSSFVLLLHEVPATVIVLTEADRKNPVSAIVRQAGSLLRSRAADFIGIAETERLLDGLAAISPAIAKNVVPRPISLVTLTEVLRRLVDEHVSIRDLRGILEALAASPLAKHADPDPAELAEAVRTRMRRPMTYALTRGSRELEAWVLDPEIEETIRRAITRTEVGSVLALAPSASRDIRSALAHAISKRDAEGLRVLLAPADLRRFVRKLVEADFPDVRVIAATEILPDVVVKPIARISPGDAV